MAKIQFPYDSKHYEMTIVIVIDIPDSRDFIDDCKSFGTCFIDYMSFFKQDGEIGYNCFSCLKLKSVMVCKDIYFVILKI